MEIFVILWVFVKVKQSQFVRAECRVLRAAEGFPPEFMPAKAGAGMTDNKYRC
jgi:hypothetical protein